MMQRLAAWLVIVELNLTTPVELLKFFIVWVRYSSKLVPETIPKYACQALELEVINTQICMGLYEYR